MKRIAILSFLGLATALVTPRSGSDDQLVINQPIGDRQQPLEPITVDTWQNIQAGVARGGQMPPISRADLEELVMAGWVKGKDILNEGLKVAGGLVADVVEDMSEATNKWVKGSLPEVWTETTTWPGQPPPALDLREYTIGQILNWTLHRPRDDPPEHHLPLRKLAFLVNISTPVQELLHDPNADITLFAPDDKALTPPHRGPPHHSFGDQPDGDVASSNLHTPFGMHVFWDAQAEMQAQACPHYRDLAGKKHGRHGDKRGEQRRKIFFHILEMVLKYHVSPGAKLLPDILDASTLATALPTSTAKSADSFRIRVGKSSLVPFHGANLNFFSKLNSRRIDTKNGVIYLIEDAPLLPPLTPLSMLYLFPQPFSTLTGGIAKVDLDKALLSTYGNASLPILAEGMYDTFGMGSLDEVDERVSKILGEILEEKKKKKNFKVKSYTVFAPTNRAFAKLGLSINALLFSPWGTPFLRYILSYHVVPGIVFHTDHIANTTSFSSFEERDIFWPEHIPEDSGDQEELAAFARPHLQDTFYGTARATLPHKVNATYYSFPTLLGSNSNQTLAVEVVQYRAPFGKGPIHRRIIVRPPPHKYGPPPKPVPVVIADGVAWSGAIHMIPSLIRPPYPSHMEKRDDCMSTNPLRAMWDQMWQ